MCVMCLKYSDNDTNYYHYQPRSNIIVVCFKHITRTVAIITHYKRMGYVIIPKQIVSSREGMNSRCRNDIDLMALQSVYTCT